MDKSILRKTIDIIKNTFSLFNILVEKKTALNSEKKLLAHLFVKKNIDYVVDIGANTGQFAKELLKMGYNNNILSFEPLPKTYAILKNTADKYSFWKTENVAVGNETKKININVSANTESSSVLPMLNSHQHLAPQANYIGCIEVDMITLDGYFANIRASNNIFLKIDVQGFEENVLLGATKFLEKVKILQLELSFIPLYDTNKKYYQLIEEIEVKGFFLYSFLPAFVNNTTGQMYQMDALFCRKSE